MLRKCKKLQIMVYAKAEDNILQDFKVFSGFHV